jgi:hypothetical protein
MAPEQALGKRAEIDGRVDIFAMGATAFRILARRRVHEADSDAGLLIAMATQPAPPLRSVVSDVPENVAAIIDLALAFNRDARYPDVRTMLNDVRAVRRGESPAFAFSQMRSRQDATRVGTNVAPLQYAAVASHDSTPGGPQPSAGGSDQRSKRAAAFMAGSLLLIGGATWALWPASEPEVSDPSAAERNDMRTTTATRPAALRESAAEASESMPEQINKQQAKARERYQRAAGTAREQEKNERKREKRK